ncbi:MAG TPA: hypothetical protein VKR99_08085 [Candidatus Eremiobacteraceae bacterium]|nr:hypothetical protein [Candidatus Eremiobacteraceae bacterium]
MKDRNKMPGGKPDTDVPPKPHEFPEYEDMPTDVHDGEGPARKGETPERDSHVRRDVDNETADVTSE